MTAWSILKLSKIVWPSPFNKLRRLLQRKRHINIERSVRLSALRLFNDGGVVQSWRTAPSFAWHEFSCKGKGKEWKTYSCGLVLSPEPQIWKFHVVVWQTTSKNSTKVRAARAARLFQLIMSCQQISPKSVPHVQPDYFPSFNQSTESFKWFVVLSLPFRRHFLNSLMIPQHFQFSVCSSQI